MEIAEGVRHNLGLKVLSAVLAILLWSFVHGSKTIEREWDIPVSYVNLPDDLMLLEPPPDKLRVRVTGPAKDLLLRLRFMRDVEARIDLRDARAPQFRATPLVRNIVAPSNVRVFFDRVLEPSVIDVRIANVIEREIPVRIVWDGDMPEGYVLLDTLRALPQSVFCSGPDFLVEGVVSIPTSPIEIRKNREAYMQKVRLEYELRNLTYAPDEVQVRIPIARLRNRTEKTALRVLTPSSGLKTQPDRQEVSVSFVGPEAYLDSLKNHDITITLDARGLGVGRYDSLEVVPHLPEWARDVSVEPARVGLLVYDPSDSTRAQESELSLPDADPNSL